MLPLGVSHAAAVRVGNLIGAKDMTGAQRAAWVAFALGGGLMLLSAFGFLVFREVLPRLYGPEPEVAALAALVLPIAAAFQFFDGLQAVGGGILRGMGRVRPAYVFNLFGYYALALPLAIWLAFPQGKDLGLAGLWWGLALGLLVIALSLIAWVAVRGPARMPRQS
jgi:MATE family multidrug resistance protein